MEKETEVIDMSNYFKDLESLKLDKIERIYYEKSPDIRDFCEKYKLSRNRMRSVKFLYRIYKKHEEIIKRAFTKTDYLITDVVNEIALETGEPIIGIRDMYYSCFKYNYKFFMSIGGGGNYKIQKEKKPRKKLPKLPKSFLEENKELITKVIHENRYNLEKGFDILAAKFGYSSATIALHYHKRWKAKISFFEIRPMGKNKKQTKTTDYIIAQTALSEIEVIIERIEKRLKAIR